GKVAWFHSPSSSRPGRSVEGATKPKANIPSPILAKCHRTRRLRQSLRCGETPASGAFVRRSSHKEIRNSLNWLCGFPGLCRFGGKIHRCKGYLLAIPTRSHGKFNHLCKRRFNRKPTFSRVVDISQRLGWRIDAHTLCHLSSEESPAPEQSKMASAPGLVNR